MAFRESQGDFSLLSHLEHGASQLGGRHADHHAGRLQGGDLLFGPALSSGDDGTGVTHPPAGGRCEAGDERHHRFGVGALNTHTVTSSEGKKGMPLYFPFTDP